MDLLLLTPSPGGSAQVLPALGLLAHRVRVLPVEPSALLDAPDADILLLDARRDLATARSTCRLLRATGLSVPLVLILTEGGLTVVTAEWGAADILLEHSAPAEVEARLRLVLERADADQPEAEPDEISSGDLTIDAGGYTARVKGRQSVRLNERRANIVYGERLNRRVKSFDLSDGYFHAMPLPHFNQIERLLVGRCNRLFDQAMYAALDQLRGYLEVG